MKKIDEKRVERTFEYIRGYIEDHEYAPSMRTIKNACGYTSTSLLNADIRRLKERGVLSADINGRLMLTSDVERVKMTVNSVLVGTVHCGCMTDAREDIEAYISLPTQIFGDDKSLVLLRASGDSMIDRQIMDGDILVVRKQSSAEVGDIVIACVCEGDESTCKTLKKTNDGVYYLHPENSSYDDIYPEEGWNIYGVVRQIIHTVK